MSERLYAFLESRSGRFIRRSLVRYFDARVVDGQRIPRDSGALLVLNHGLWGVDSWLLGAMLWTEVGRMPTWLGERNLFDVPILGRALRSAKAVPGSRDIAVDRLRRGELVVVYPGGILDAYKHSSERHKLKWGSRSGFAHVAHRARAPIVPIAACGVDDMYRVVGREPGLGELLFGHPRYNFPIALGRAGSPVPRRVRVVFRVGSPIEITSEFDGPDGVEALRRRAHDAVSRLLALDVDG